MTSVDVFREQLHPLWDGRSVLIRPAEPRDAEAIIRYVNLIDTQSPFMTREPGEFMVTVDQERQLIAGMGDMRQWFVAVLEGEVVGQVDVARRHNRQRLRHRAGLGISVVESLGGQGLGRALMDRAIAWCREKLIEQLELEVVADNHRAISLYCSLGFVQTGRLPHAFKYRDGSYADELQMVLMLGA